jgi:hypothetical protein
VAHFVPLLSVVEYPLANSFQGSNHSNANKDMMMRPFDQLQFHATENERAFGERFAV